MMMTMTMTMSVLGATHGSSAFHWDLVQLVLKQGPAGPLYSDCLWDALSRFLLLILDDPLVDTC